MKDISHILFDFFGTLVDYSASRTEQGYERTYRLLREAGTRLDYDGFLRLWSDVSESFEDEALSTLREFSMREVATTFLREAAPDANEALVGDFVSTYLAEWSKGVRYMDGLGAMLERLGSRYGLAVITNTHDPELVPGHLAKMGIAHMLEPVVMSVELGWRKPSPAIFQHALELLDARPEHCVYVGDNYEADYRGARAAGLQALLIDPHARSAAPKANRLASVLELGPRLES